MADTSTLSRSKNLWRCYGTVEEISLKLEDVDIKLKKDGKDDGTKKGQRVYGTVALRAGTAIYEVNVFAQSLNSDGTENKRWKMYADMMKWNPHINGDGTPPTLVMCEGALEVNDYVAKDGNLACINRYRVNKATTKVAEDVEQGMSWSGTVYLKTIKPEVVNEQETGRLEVVMLTANNNGAVYPITAYVSADMADDFAEVYEVGMSVWLSCDVESRHVGGGTTKKKLAFGQASKVNTDSIGFDRIELIIVNGGDPIEAPDPDELVDDEGNPIEDKSGYMNPTAVKKALKEREKMLEEKKAEGYKGGSGDTAKKTSVAEARKSFGKKKPAAVEDDDDDLDF